MPTGSRPVEVGLATTPAAWAGRSWVLGLGAFGILLLLPFLGYEGGFLRKLILIAIYTLLVSGLCLTLGYGGALVMSQAAVLALGAYTAAILARNGVDDLAVAFVVTMAASALLGLVTGIPGLRISDMALGLITFFMVLLVGPIALWFPEQTGGHTGIYGLINPTFLGIEIEGSAGLYVLCVLAAGSWLVIMRNLVLSRFGLALRVLKENPVLASSLGLPVLRLRFTAYVLGSLPAGVAGCLFAYASAYVSPSSFDTALTIAVVAACVVGGPQSIYGAPIGAALLVLGPFSADGFERYSMIVYGLFLLLVGTVLASGVTGGARTVWARLGRRRAGRPRRDAGLPRPDALRLDIDGAVLRVSAARRSFGEVEALRGVDLTARPGRITALIGANGAGKTTLLNAISGAIALDAGTVQIDGRDLSTLGASQRARAGVARTFQTPMIPSQMSVLEVAQSGCLSAGPLGGVRAVLRSPRFREQRRRDEAVALAALDVVGLADRSDAPATRLPLSDRRLLEVVRAIAGQPKVILLDEPAAGMDDDAIGELRELLSALRTAGATVVLIEHNISFVLGIADDVCVLDLGGLLATGTPEEIRRDERVIASYLGKRHAMSAATEPASPGGAQ